ncbi:collagen-like protein [[Scytonema hofmanni] UTEX B 1581]|uniref:collagen-like protein n=1 Tax=[Scytonema hofmanni] UTEX B 1581 TaxID=379535 RepID=UPI0004978231|nr:collagen-like protein [[Scytonema hofmanni] UTEX B 1581]
MGVPSSPATKSLQESLNVVGKVVKTSKYKFADWNIKLPKGTTKLPEAEFKKLSRAATFFREGHFTTEDIKKVQDTAREAKSKVKEAEKLAKESKNLWDKFLSKAKGASQAAKAIEAGSTVAKSGAFLVKFAPLLAAVAAIGVSLLVNELQSWRADMAEEGQQLLSQSISQVLGLMNVQKLKIDKINVEIKKADLENQRTRDRIYGVEKQLPGIRESVVEAKKQANDALYEVRQGRVKTDIQIAEAKKQANDALYEVRQGRVKTDIQIAEAKKQANDALYEIRQGRQTIDREINDAKRIASDAKLTAERISSAIESLKARVGDAYNTATKALTRADQLPKIIEGKPGKDGVPGKAGTNGIQGIPGKDGVTKIVTIPGIPGRDGNHGIPGTDGKPGKDGKDGKDGKPGKDLEMDEATKELIRKTAQNAAFIPALVARPAPLSADQTISAAAAGTCRTLQPGGCSAKALDGLGNGVNQNTNNQIDGLLNKLNAGANAAQLALLRVIDNKLGAQIPNGGISKFLNVFLDTFNNFTSWTRLDRLLNMLIFAATIQNHLMLSRDIGTTLIGAFTNILTLVGLKDSEGNTFNVEGVIRFCKQMN